MQNQQSNVRLITLQDVYNGVSYNIRPGNSYELVSGVEATMLAPTINRVKEWDALTTENFKLENDDAVLDPSDTAYYVRALAAKVLICCALPNNIDSVDSLLALEGLTTVPLKRIVHDFTRLK